MAYRIGDDKVVEHLVGWASDKKFAYSLSQELHDKFLLAILAGKRIAIKLASGPVHILWKCSRSWKEGMKYLEMLDSSKKSQR